MIGLGSDILDIRRIEKTLSRFGKDLRKGSSQNQKLKNVNKER